MPPYTDPASLLCAACGDPLNDPWIVAEINTIDAATGKYGTQLRKARVCDIECVSNWYRNAGTLFTDPQVECRWYKQSPPRQASD